MSDADEVGKDRHRQIQAEAGPADHDTENDLRDLQNMADARRKDPILEQAYSQLRDDLVRRLQESGPRYYIDDLGVKRYAYVVAPEPLEVEVELLMGMDEAGELKAGVLEKVAPRKVDKEAFRREVATGNITREQLLAVSKLKKGTAHVQFSNPVDQE